MTDISKMNKDELAKLAKEQFNVELDLRRTLDLLREDVTKLQSKATQKAAPSKVTPKATHILNRNTGRWFPYTKQLEDYLTNAVLCDENGKPV